MDIDLATGGLYQFNAPELPGVFTGPFQHLLCTCWDRIDLKSENGSSSDMFITDEAIARPLRIESGATFLVVDKRSILFTPSVQCTMYKIIISDIVGWVWFDPDPELWENYGTALEYCFSRIG